ncbi:hypothetical protein BCR42DRAFT_228583 [Absidia repens]|uniref:Uncharacterized protein n=1 Tax=Absidia repens TaxID=90262 RepID=A0A1X2IL79_9FUNG|nr:hypothetical protein BCR42DRAFT_228583 [Absidia repens]
MRFSILSVTLLAFLFICQVWAATTFNEPKANKMMMFPRDAPALPLRAQAAETAPATTQVAPKKKAKAPTIWASPEILQNGTLFYIAISISTLLWCTGKGVDMTLDQQERRAEYMARR